ncbi:hypothetical protein HDU80_009877 [Chytriomyces hyalinus]|nr:hypothetical protein HDU80_009877 [Chytriomyces hyalinus]
MDQQFIELFELRNVVADPRYLPDWPEIQWKEGMIATMLFDGGLKGMQELMPADSREVNDVSNSRKEQFTDVHDFVKHVQKVYLEMNQNSVA